MLTHKTINLYVVLVIVLTLAVNGASAEYELDALPEGLTSGSESENSAKAVDNVVSDEEEADNYFYAGMQADDKNLKEAYLSKALVKYMLLLSINPNNASISAQVGAIHDSLGHQRLAKEYLFRGVSLEPFNPFPNYYFAEYYFAKKDYENALRYFQAAYDNGYSSFYEVNLKLATVYERLGDIEKAKLYYGAAAKLNPGFQALESKVKSLDKVYYNKEEYHRY